jgi:hypothetical protein
MNGSKDRVKLVEEKEKNLVVGEEDSGFISGLLDRHMLSARMAVAFEWDKWVRDLPFLEFPSHWRVKIVPPYFGAIIRFYVDDKRGGCVSVYLDGCNHLGYGPHPYWEAYAIDGGAKRFLVGEVEVLFSAINEELERRARVR